jgi:DNA (cytosine-5)-methyltransferase 1
LDNSIPFKCVAYSEIDAKAIQTYCTNFNTENELAIGDIVEFTSSAANIQALEDFELLTGGFPCQTFSMMGSKAGFNEDRGQMFFRIMDIVKVKHPRYILLENVKNLVTHDQGNTLKQIIKNLESEEYIVHYDVFNTSDFGLPQTRNRTLIFARWKEDGDFTFNREAVAKSFSQLSQEDCSLKFYQSTIEILSTEVDRKYYLSEKIKPTILSDGTKTFRSNSDIDKLTARTLTASMHKMHRACQDNYYSDEFIKSKGKTRPSVTLTKEELAKLPIRRLTPQEAFLLQGFPAEFATQAQNNGVSDGALYKQAGNAVSVNTIYAVLNYLIKNKYIVQ